MGVKPLKLFTIAPSIWNITWQYLTAGFSWPDGTYGLTTWINSVKSWRWSALRSASMSSTGDNHDFHTRNSQFTLLVMGHVCFCHQFLNDWVAVELKRLVQPVDGLHRNNA